MSALPNTPSERIDFRVSPTNKSLIERAASIQGQTISGFAIATLVKAAEEAIERETVRTLSARDSEMFLAMLSSDKAAGKTLKTAARRYKESRGR